MGLIFTFLHLIFDVDKAKKIVAKKYTPEPQQPSVDWLLPLVYIDETYVPQADLLKTVIFATLPADEQVCKYLIDGNHTVTRALREGAPTVNVVTLTVGDSLKILKSRKDIRNTITASARKLGLI